MTIEQALRKARRAWGPRGHVQARRYKKGGEERYEVGTVALGMFFNIIGESTHSWEEAFRKAYERWPAGSRPF